MKILVIKGSPHRKGSSNLLADQFILGAKEAGHEIVTFDAGHAKIAPCLACEACHKTGSGVCCLKDDMQTLKEELMETEMVVFVTPVYWHNTSAQIKLAIDRMYAFYDTLNIKRACLIAAANNANEHIMDPLVMTYKDICRSLRCENAGMILAYDCGNVEATQRSKFPEEAYETGKVIEK